MLITNIEEIMELQLSFGMRILLNRLKSGLRKWLLMVRWRTQLLMRGQVRART